MYSLTIEEILSYVRTSMDEIELNASSALGVQSDDLAIETLTKESIVEAIFNTHMIASPSLLYGKMANDSDYKKTVLDGVCTIEMNVDVLRITSFHSMDSDVVLTAIIEEDSPEGRMQNNPYVRGIYDSPVLVVTRKSTGYKPVLKYFSLKDKSVLPENVKLEISYIPMPEKGRNSYEISPDLRFAVLNMVVSIVLMALREEQLSGIFKSRAEAYLK